MSTQLYTPKDVQKTREGLLKEQGNRDRLTGLIMPDGKAVLDHNHKTQFIRGVLHRSVNACLGTIENNYKRHLASWYPHSLSDFLRDTAQYLEKSDDERFLHPGWIKKSCTEFNKLPEKSKDNVLKKLGLQQGKNGVERKTIFKKALLSKGLIFQNVLTLIKQETEE